MLNTLVDAGVKRALDSPVGKKEEFLIFACLVRQDVLEEPGQEVGLHPAEGTGKQPVSLNQGNRRSALGAVMFNNQIDGGLPFSACS